MAKQKTASYDLYHLAMDDLTKAIRKKGPRTLKKQSDLEILKDYFLMTDKEGPNLLFPSMSEEYAWATQSGLVVMLADQHLVESLYRAKFEISSAEHLKFPDKTFMLSVPAGTQIDGYDIPPALVTWEPLDSTSENLYIPFANALGMNMGKGTPQLREGLDPAKPSMSLLYELPGRNGRQRLNVHCDDLAKIIEADSAQAIHEIVGSFSSTTYTNIEETGDLGLNIQARLVKLIVAMAVYHTATREEGTLLNGVPCQTMRFTRPKGKNYRFKTLASISATRQGKRIVGMEHSEHYRSWHFRQLRHARYYQGIHEGQPQGSRIVFVSDSTVRRTRKIYSDDEMLDLSRQEAGNSLP